MTWREGWGGGRGAQAGESPIAVIQPDRKLPTVMSTLMSAALDALLVLNRTGVVYALCGGLAVGVHGFIRATKDIDVVVDTDADAAVATQALLANGWLAHADTIDFPDGFRLLRLFKVFGRDLHVLDLLRSPDGQSWARHRERSELDGAICWVLDRPTLIGMKRLAGRPQDLIDIQNLETTGHG